MRDDVDFDENCDPNNPRKIKYDDILAASRRIIGSVIRTPCTKAHMSEKLGMEIYLKQEFLQFTGSTLLDVGLPKGTPQCTVPRFLHPVTTSDLLQERGVRNTLMLLTEDQKKYGVIAATRGNHGIAMSYHCSQLGIPCIIVIPTTGAINKVNKCEKFGVKVILHGANLTEARSHAMMIGKEKKMTYINGFDHPNVVEGQGSVGIEIIEQVPAVDAILVPTGGGSLVAGIAVAAKHLKPDTEIYGITTDKTSAMVESLRKNERVRIEIESTIADGLAVNMVGVNTFHTLKGVLDKMIVVKEDWVARAIMHLAEDEKYVIEGAGAVSIAAIMAGLFPNLKGKKVVCVLTGGNISTIVLSRALERGMSAEGRLVKFKVTVQDRPGGMADLCALLSGIGVTLRDCVPERAWVKGDVFSVELRVICETRGWDHTKELMEQIKKHFKDYYFQDMSERPDKSAGTRRGPCLAPNPVCMQK